MGLLRRLIDWIKHKLGYLTSSDLLKYREYLRYPDIYRDKFFIDTKLHDKIFDEVFSQYSRDKKIQEKMTFGLRSLYAESDYFAGIVKNSILSAIEESSAHVADFKHLAFWYIIFGSCDKEKEIRASVATRESQMMRGFGPLMRLLRSVTLGEGYSINELWDEFFAELRRVRRSWNWNRT